MARWGPLRYALVEGGPEEGPQGCHVGGECPESRGGGCPHIAGVPILPQTTRIGLVEWKYVPCCASERFSVVYPVTLSNLPKRVRRSPRLLYRTVCRRRVLRPGSEEYIAVPSNGVSRERQPNLRTLLDKSDSVMPARKSSCPSICEVRKAVRVQLFFAVSSRREISARFQGCTGFEPTSTEPIPSITILLA